MTLSVDCAAVPSSGPGKDRKWTIKACRSGLMVADADVLLLWLWGGVASHQNAHCASPHKRLQTDWCSA